MWLIDLAVNAAIILVDLATGSAPAAKPVTPAATPPAIERRCDSAAPADGCRVEVDPARPDAGR